jgi:GNAT superfamily N-acetyltransferase
MSSPTLSVRPILPEERARFDETLECQHWLGGGLVGEVMRYVAEGDGEWCALLGFGSAALCVRSREELVTWSDAQRYRRLRYITNNQRFCILDEHRRKNLASEVLSLTLKRISEWTFALLQATGAGSELIRSRWHQLVSGACPVRPADQRSSRSKIPSDSRSRSARRVRSCRALSNQAR